MRTLIRFIRRLFGPCRECGGSGVVFGVGVDDVPWQTPCPWCRP